jgi:hypothetical protein
VRTVAVRIVACEPNTMEGAVARLSAHPDIAVLTRDHTDEPDVLLVVTTQLTETTLCGLELASVSAGHPPRLVVVVEHIEPWQLDRAMGAGLVCVLDRHTAGYDLIAQAIITAGTAPTRRAACVTTAVTTER